MTLESHATMIETDAITLKQIQIYSTHVPFKPIRWYGIVCLGLAAMAGTKQLFAANLRALLDQKRHHPPDGESRADWSQAALARRLGVNAGSVTRWLDGEVLPQADQLDALSELLAVPVMRFFSDPSQEKTLMTLEEAVDVLSDMVRARKRAK